MIVLLVSENSPAARLSAVVELFVANHYIMAAIDSIRIKAVSRSRNW